MEHGHFVGALRLEAHLCGVSPPVTRPIFIAEQAPLSRLHAVLQVAFGWSHEHLYTFRIRVWQFGDPARYLELALLGGGVDIPLAAFGFETRTGGIYHWEFERRGQVMEVDVRGHLTLDDERLMIEAAIGGLGIAFVAEGTASEAIARRKLTLVLDEWCTPFPGLCLYYSGHRQVPAALRAFVDLLKDAAPHP